MNLFRLGLCAGFCATLLVTAPLRADLIFGSASSAGVQSNLDLVVGSVELDIAPTPTVSGAASPPFNVSDSALAVNGTAGIDIPPLGTVPILNLSTGVVDVAAASDVDGGAGSRSTSGSSTVNNLQFDVDSVTGLVVSSLVSLQAAVIQSTAMVTGTPGALMAVGSAQLVAAQLNVLGTNIGIAAMPAANTHITIDSSVVPTLTGSIDVFLNEQIIAGDFMSNGSLTVNALRLSFNDVEVSLGSLPAELLNGELIVGQSTSMLATPEPSSLGLCGVFLGVAGWKRRRSRIHRRRANHA